MVRRGISQGTNPTPIWRRLRLISALKLAHNGKMHFYDLSKIRSLRSFFSKTMRWRVIYEDGQRRYSPGDESHANLEMFTTFLCAQNGSFLSSRFLHYTQNSVVAQFFLKNNAMEGDVKDWDWETWPMGRIPHYFWYVFSHIWLSNQPSRRKLVKYRDLGVAGVVFQFFLKRTTMKCEIFFSDEISTGGGTPN